MTHRTSVRKVGTEGSRGGRHSHFKVWNHTVKLPELPEQRDSYIIRKAFYEALGTEQSRMRSILLSMKSHDLKYVAFCYCSSCIFLLYKAYKEKRLAEFDRRCGSN